MPSNVIDQSGNEYYGYSLVEVIQGDDASDPEYLTLFREGSTAGSMDLYPVSRSSLKLADANIWSLGQRHRLTGYDANSTPPLHTYGDLTLTAKSEGNDDVVITDTWTGVVRQGRRLPVEDFVLHLDPSYRPLHLERRNEEAGSPEAAQSNEG